jgi:hypothetical protein
MAQVGLALHPEKAKIVYCKDRKPRLDHEHTSFTFLGYTFRLIPGGMPGLSRGVRLVGSWRTARQVTGKLGAATIRSASGASVIRAGVWPRISPSRSRGSGGSVCSHSSLVVRNPGSAWVRWPPRRAWRTVALIRAGRLLPPSGPFCQPGPTYPLIVITPAGYVSPG